MKNLIAILVIFSLLLTGCTSDNTITQDSSSQISQTQTGLSDTEMFTAGDKEIGYDESTAKKIVLNNESVTVTQEGVYILSGNISSGQVIVEVGDTQKVQLVLDAVNITCKNSAAIYIKSADKVFITLVNENNISVTGEYISDGVNNVDAVIFSKSDITFNGSGSLNINAVYGHGIVGKDDVVFTSGDYTVTAQNHGISANDSVRVAQGDFNITSGKDGIQVENSENAEKGFIYILNGNFNITAEGDGLSATGIVEIENGEFDITTGAGSESVTLQVGVGGFMPNMTQQIISNTDTASQKGVKTDSELTIKNGTFTIDTIDDSVHAGGDIFIYDGIFNLKSGDDAIHSDTAATIKNGTFNIPYCYEGIEAVSITVDGGTFDIISADDGFNAAGGTDSSGFAERKGGFDIDDNAFIIINDGKITIVSDGDSIDSNGTLTINGGVLNLTCNGNGNTAIDTSGTYSNNGGEITTNDGSESGTHMGQGKPGGAGGGGMTMNKEKPKVP